MARLEYHCNDTIRIILLILVVVGLPKFALGQELSDLEGLDAKSRIDSLNEWAWNNMGWETEKALQFAELALIESQEIEYLLGEGNANNRLGAIHRIKGEHSKSLEQFQKALEIRKSLDDRPGTAGVYGNIGNLYLNQENYGLAKSAFRKALKIYQELEMPYSMFNQYNGLGIANEDEGHLDSAIIYYRLALGCTADDITGHYQKGMGYLNLGIPFLKTGEKVVQTNPAQASMYLDSAELYFRTSQRFLTEVGDSISLVEALNNQGLVALARKNYRFALDSCLNPALNIHNHSQMATKSLDLFYNLYLAHQHLEQTDSALHYLEEYYQINEELEQKNQDFNELQLNFLAKEQEQERQILRAESRQKTTLLIATAIIAALILAIAAIIWRSGRRRLRAQRELNQEREALNAQRILELVQEQELRSLDALLEGQEKERQRVAQDLHDRLGGLMATVKLHFNALERNIRPEQQATFRQADQLIDDTCSEIRKISHDLAEGQLAAFGLITALRDLADGISGAGSLQVKVYEQNMKDRLPLALERDIYKIVQESLTNVIKHAEATEVTVQLVRHQDHLNLMVEDNGIGISPRQPEQTKEGKRPISPTAGLGLKSMQGRIKAMKGVFHIDSRQGAGTTILIDIPLPGGDPDS